MPESVVGNAVLEAAIWCATTMRGAFMMLTTVAAIVACIKIGTGSWLYGITFTFVSAAAGFGFGWLLYDAYGQYRIPRLITASIANVGTVLLLGYLIFG